MANNLVTEYYLASNFTPKAGITPGSNDHVIMTADEIKARYNVTVSPSTGNYCPKQSELTGALNKAFVKLLQYSGWADSANVSTNLIISSNTKLIVLTIQCPNSVTKRTATTQPAPTFGGQSFTQAGANYMNSPVEIWYMINPPTGNQQIVIPSTTYITWQVTMYYTEGVIGLHSTDVYGETSINPVTTVTSPQNQEILIIDSVAVNKSPIASEYLFYTSNTHTVIQFSNPLGTFASGAQYKTLNSQSTVFHTLMWTLTTDKCLWYAAAACFKST